MTKQRFCIVCGKEIDFGDRKGSRSKVCLNEDDSHSVCFKIRQANYAGEKKIRIRKNRDIIYAPLIKPTITRRQCLGTLHNKPYYFDSKGPGHRICGRCKAANEGVRLRKAMPILTSRGGK